MNETLVGRDSQNLTLSPRKRHWFFGVILPALALLIELTQGWCTEAYMDPLPVWTCVLGVAAVPLLWANWLVRLRRGDSVSRTHRLLLFGITGFAAAYVLVLHEMIIPGAFMVLGFGIGLLPLSPLFVLVLGLLQCRHWIRPPSGPLLRWRAAIPVAILGFGVGIAPFALDGYVVLTLNRAATKDPATIESSLRSLRRMSPEFVARVCEQRRMAWLAMKDPDSIAQTYFRTFGIPIQDVLEAVEPPEGRGRLSFGPDVESWDQHLGGTQVGPRRKHLRLTDNRMDVRIDEGAGVAQIEWEFVWENNAQWQQEEARMVLHVPGVGAATRLTLWVSGEPQEAAFGPRAQVRTAYQQVAVQQRRDPALLTTCGPDRLLLQCFPIPPASYLKVRVGLTLPFEPDGEGHSNLLLPIVQAANFHVDSGTLVPIWIEGGAGAKLRQAGSDTLIGDSTSVQWSVLGRGEVALSMPGNLSKEGRLSGDEREAVVVRETTRTIPAADKWVVVIDGSAPAGARMDELARALATLPGHMSLWWVGEGEGHLRGATGSEAAAWLRERKCLGGHDAAEVLAKAWDEASSLGAPLLWLHGSLPLTWSPTGALRQRLDRRPDAVAFHLVSLVPGENLLLSEFDAFPGEIETWSALETGAVLRVLGDIASERKVRAWERAAQPAEVGGAVLSRAEPAVRLWIADRIVRERSSEARAELVGLATRLGVVSAHTGAVVLERAADYKRHELEQQNPLTVPQVPEPAHIAFAAGAAALGIVVLHRIRVRRRASCQMASRL